MKKQLTYSGKIIHLATKYNVTVAVNGSVTLTDYTGKKKLIYAPNVHAAHRAIFGY